MEIVPTKQVFYTKVDIWLIALIMACTLIPFFITMSADQNEGTVITGVILVIFLVFILACVFYIHYDIEDTKLTVHSFPLLKKSYDLMDLKVIASTHNPISSPASSLDRLELTFGNGDTVIISPKQKSDFLDALYQVNSKIVFKQKQRS